MFNDLLKENVILKYPLGSYSDGEADFAQVEGKAFVFDYNERLLRDIGMVKNAKFFVIAATDAVKTCFAVTQVDVQIIHNERLYDLKTVRSCRNFDGVIECFSCTGV